MILRCERASDHGAIADLTEVAFATEPHSQHTEQHIIHALRSAGVLTLSLVAEVEGRVVGHVAFSPVTVSGRDLAWYGLGPLAVLPDHQGRGLGSALVREGLRRLGAAGAKGCVLVGHPDFYRRFGFRNLPGLVLEGVPPEVFLALPLGPDEIVGTVRFHEGFEARAPDPASSGGGTPCPDDPS